MECVWLLLLLIIGLVVVVCINIILNTNRRSK